MLRGFDRSLLGLAEILVEKFNWLTGKDNVWLAMIVNVLAAGVGVYVMRQMPGMIDYFIVALFFVLNSFVIIYTSFLYKKDIQGLKIQDFSNRMRSVRLMMFCLFVFSWSIFVVIDNLDSSVVSPLFPIYFFMLLATLYIIGVSRPPFKESKALEELEKTLSQNIAEPAKIKTR